jgi:leucyl/phenylalanyl-tRNA--protein transferase
MPTGAANDFPNPALAPADIDLIAISAVDSAGGLLTKNLKIEWPKLTFYGSSWDSDVLLTAYRSGMFPMPYELAGDEQAISWWSPAQRAIFQPNAIVTSSSLRRSAKKFTVTADQDFEAVIRACGNPARPSGWINHDVIAAFCELFRLGIAHSVEVWNQRSQLVGGLYGLDLGGVFAAESMFHTETDASKVALVHLGGLLNDGTARIIDTQWLTDHLESMGATTLPRREYCDKLPQLLALPNAFPVSA